MVSNQLRKDSSGLYDPPSKIRILAVGNQPFGNQPRQISHRFKFTIVVGNQPHKDSSGLNDPPSKIRILAVGN